MAATPKSHRTKPRRERLACVATSDGSLACGALIDAESARVLLEQRARDSRGLGGVPDTTTPAAPSAAAHPDEGPPDDDSGEEDESDAEDPTYDDADLRGMARSPKRRAPTKR